MTKFAWSPKTNLSNDTILNPKAFPSKDTKYIVTVSKYSCSYSDTIEIKIDSIYADAGVDTSICEGQLFKLYGKSNSTLSWSPGVDLSDSTISNPFATTKISSKFILTAKGPFGCIKRDTLNVSVVNISVNAGLDKNICLVDSIQLNGNGSGVLTWNTSNSLSNNMLPNPFAKPINTTEYILTANQNNCSRSDIVKIVVSKIIVDAGSNQTICNPDSIQLNASGGKIYLWSPGAITNDSISQSPKAYVSQTTKFILIATDSIGCIGQDSTTIYLASKAISISSMDTSICKGETVPISVVGTGYYLWSTIQTDSIISVSPTLDTKYWVISSPPGMCVSDTSYTKVQVYELPLASFNVNIETGLKPLEVNFNNTSSNFSDFVWKFGDGDTSKLSNVSHIYHDIGTYNAKLIAVNGNGCYDSTLKTIIVFDSFLVFIPNTFSPNNDNRNDAFNIHYDKGNVKEGYVNIYNRWGERIYSSNLLDFIPWDGTYKGKPVQIDVYLLILEVTNKQNEQYIRHELINVLK